MNTAKKAATVLMAVGIAAGISTGSALANSGAAGSAVKSPGAGSGNVWQMPIHMPINVCGNSVTPWVGVLNPAFGNTCINIDEDEHGRHHEDDEDEHGRHHEDDEGEHGHHHSDEDEHDR